MEDKAFNLLEEPWILVTDTAGANVEMSLTDVIVRAHEIKALSGELPAQDAAILRMLLAVLYAVFTRVDETGAVHDEDYDALALWKRLWDMERFPEDVIGAYLERFRDRFWLVHPERPFYQIAGLSKGTNYTASKLMGDLSESSNKKRLFQNRSGSAKGFLEYAQAARWLIHLNAFDDTSSKASVRGQKMPSPGAGWLGKLGIIYAVGNNLFETLMLNFSLLDSGGNRWEEGNATWELDSPRHTERVEIPLPNSQIELLSLQSRRVLLERSNGVVTGYILLGGDFFQKENAFSEQMTLWRWKDKKEEDRSPKRHDPSKQFWRDFVPLLERTETMHQPGILKWLTILRFNGLIPSRHVRMCAVSVQYGDKDFFVVDAWEDSVSINTDLLSELGEKWMNPINGVLDTTNKMATALGYLAADIATSSGDSDGLASKRRAAREEAYFNFDMPFRTWLSGIDPEHDDIDETCNAWKTTARGIILKLGEGIVAQAGTQAFVGREVGLEKNKNLFTAPKAYIKFKNYIAKIMSDNVEENNRKGGHA